MRLRQRLINAREREQREEDLERIHAEYERRTRSLGDFDAIVGDSSLDASIRARYRIFAEVMEEEPDEVPAREPEAPPAESDDLVLWQQEAQSDRRTNFLFEEYVRQLTQVHPLALELEEFSEVVAARAVLRLLAYVPRGGALLESLYDEGDVPNWENMRSAARTAIANHILDEHDDERFLARLFWEVPGSRRAVYRILGSYKEIVRLQAEKDAESVDGELPGDELRQPVYWDQLAKVIGTDPEMPHEPAVVLDINLERAMLAVLRGQLSIRKASEEYDIPYSRLQREIRRRRKEERSDGQRVS